MKTFHFAAALACMVLANGTFAEEEFKPEIVQASSEAEQAIKNFQLPPGMKAEVFAAEPQLANPVGLSVDLKGRVYIAETFRAGISDIDGVTGATLDTDLPHRTIEDRIEFLKKRWGADMAKFTRVHERIHMLEDSNGDGRADRDSVFMSNGEMVSGIGASVLAYKGDVYWANVPRLWKLRDTDGDGKADARETLHYGFGVHGGIRGHDLHGLRIGPDGKLYFSMGDRGFHIVTKDRTLSSPDTGGVLRCNLDGSELEIFALGLRNPQDLAFDEFGNLFTGDNDSGIGDKCRVQYLVEGSDNGWRNAYQFIHLPNPRGMWNQEKLWHKAFKGQAAYVLPAMAYLTNGPAGLTFYPGTGLSEHFNRRFFLADFRYSAAGSGLHTFTLDPKGASFEFNGVEKSIWGVLLTDADFGPDSQLYCSDWVSGGEMPKKGRVYRIFDAELAKSALVLETKSLLNEGMEQRSSEELIKLLAHPNMMVRREAQFQLAAPRNEIEIRMLIVRAQNPDHQLARIHAIWALGQIGRAEKSAFKPLVPLLADDDAEIRAQAARVLGDGHYKSAYKAMVPLLKDASLRVQFFAGLALSKFGEKDALEPLLDMLRNNADVDPFVRHAAVMGLVGTQSPSALLKHAGDASASVRMGILLALRRLANPEIARYLSDSDPLLVIEAARAIHDVPIPDAMPELAKMLDTLPPKTPPALHGQDDARLLLLRVINANFRLGTPHNAEVLAAFAQRSDVAMDLRVEALQDLAEWAAPHGRDRVLNMWRPVAPRDAAPAVQAAKAFLLEVLKGAPSDLQAPACSFAGKHKLTEAAPALHALTCDEKQNVETRVAAFNVLAEQKYEKMLEVVRAVIASKETKLRQSALQYLAAANAADAVPLLGQTLDSAPHAERQTAIALLAKMKRTDADAILQTWLDKLLAGEAPAEIQLDLLEAAQASANGALKQRAEQHKAKLPAGDDLAPYKIALTGGDSVLGRKVFFENEKVQCSRCHKISNKGGEVGPDLSKVAATRDRNYLLESLIVPNAQIAQGFEINVVALNDGRVVIGNIKTDNDKILSLLAADGKLTEIPKDQIKSRKRSKESAMPPMGEVLTKRELRDVMEFLSRQK